MKWNLMQECDSHGTPHRCQRRCSWSRYASLNNHVGHVNKLLININKTNTRVKNWVSSLHSITHNRIYTRYCLQGSAPTNMSAVIMLFALISCYSQLQIRLGEIISSTTTWKKAKFWSEACNTSHSGPTAWSLCREILPPADTYLIWVWIRQSWSREEKTILPSRHQFHKTVLRQ